MRRATALAVLLIAAGCGDNDSGRDVVANALGSVGDIRSGTLRAQLIVTPKDAKRHPFGFRLTGPFRFGNAATARMRYTQIANGTQETATFVLEPSDAYALIDGHRRSLPRARVDDIRGAATAARSSVSGLVDVSSWVKDSQLTDCPSGAGETRCVKGDLDAAQAVTGLLGFAQAFAASDGNVTLTNADSDRLREAVRKATFFVEAGKDDGLLRDLRADLSLALDVPAVLQSALGRLVGADIRFDLGIDHPNGH